MFQYKLFHDFHQFIRNLIKHSIASRSECSLCKTIFAHIAAIKYCLTNLIQCKTLLCEYELTSLNIMGYV